MIIFNLLYPQRSATIPIRIADFRRIVLCSDYAEFGPWGLRKGI